MVPHQILVGEVGEHPYRCEACDASRGGAIRRENVGMSNRNPPEKGGHRKPKVSLAMIVSQGLGGPNPPLEMVGGMDSRLIFRPSLT